MSPQVAWHENICLFGCDAEQQQLLHGAVHARPLNSIAVIAGVEEAHASSAVMLTAEKFAGEQTQHLADCLPMSLESFGVKPDIHRDAFGCNVVGGVLLKPYTTKLQMSWKQDSRSSMIGSSL